MNRLRRRWQSVTQQPEDGRIIVLAAGLFALLGLLVMGGVDVTAVQIARVHVLDAADAAAISAADALDKGGVYGEGVDERIPLSTSSVQQDAQENLAAQELPANVTGWALVPGTGSTDGSTAVVRMTGNVRPPLLGGVLSFFGANVSVTVESKARSDVG